MRLRNLTTAILLLTLPSALSSQQIWPGDVNNNGIVNEVDLLFWGLAYGSTGAARALPGTDWQAYQAPVPWAQSFPNGVNFAYADCNGDGLVDDSDVDDAIETNFGLQHQTPLPEGFANASAGNAPKLRLQPSVSVVEEGAMFDITLSIDDTEMPLDSFYAIALSLSFTTGLLEDDDGIDFGLEPGNWIGADNSYIEEVFYESISQGKAALAITRTNQAPVPAQPGAFGRFSIVIEDIIVGLAIDTLELRVDSVMLITPGYSIIPAVPDSARILVVKDTMLLSSDYDLPVGASESVRIYPQPADNTVFLDAGIPLTNLVLIDPAGRYVATGFTALDGRRYRLNCAGLASGMYWFRAQSEEGIIYKKVIISH